MNLWGFVLQGIMKKKKVSHEEFVKRVYSIFNKDDFLIVNKYIRHSESILIKSKYGEHLIQPQNLLEGKRPSIHSAINKTEYCINQFKEIHSDIYNYSKVNYIDSKTPVIITCKVHGDFEQNVFSHRKGYGCSKCTIRKSLIKTEKAYIRDAKKVHNNTYIYKNINYKGSIKKIEIICRVHGKFKINASNHLVGQGCKICKKEEEGSYNGMTTKEFITKLNKVLPNFKLKGKYKNMITKVIVNDGRWNYKVFPQYLLKGIKPSISTVFQKDKYCIDKLKETHGDRYDYGLVKYEKQNSKIKIICKIHGHFLQTVQSHREGAGCPKCSFERMGWTYQKWQNMAKKSKNFDSFKVYIIKCYNGVEKFYKVGRTYKTLVKRFKGKIEMPYKYKVIKIIKSENPRYICNLETNIKRNNKENEYIPQRKFRGMTECFKKINEIKYD